MHALSGRGKNRRVLGRVSCIGKSAAALPKRVLAGSAERRLLLRNPLIFLESSGIQGGSRVVYRKDASEALCSSYIPIPVTDELVDTRILSDRLSAHHRGYHV